MSGVSRPAGIAIVAVLVVFAVFTFYPFVFVLITSVKSTAQFLSTPLAPALPFHWANYASAWHLIGRNMLNTVLVIAVSVPLALAISGLAAYVFGRVTFPGKGVLFYAIIGLLMIPGIFTLIPLYIEMIRFHLTNSLWALILPYIAGSQALNIFVLRGFFAELPEEVFESGRIDGAGELTLFVRFAVPMSQPILISLGLLMVLTIWNDYLWPSVVLSNPHLWTISMALVSYQSQYFTQTTQYGPMFAGYVIASLPLLILFFVSMNRFIEGITAGSLKL